MYVSRTTLYDPQNDQGLYILLEKGQSSTDDSIDSCLKSPVCVVSFVWNVLIKSFQ